MELLDTWKTQLPERLRNWRRRMAGFGVNSVYSSLSTMTLWPVAEAAKGGEWSPLPSEKFYDTVGLRRKASV